MSAKLKIVKRQEVSDEVLFQLALEMEREHDKNLERLCKAVLTDDVKTAKKLAKELLPDATN